MTDFKRWKDMKNKHYSTLGVAFDATQEEIKKAYRDMSKKLHPDANNGDDKGFAELARAYEVLSDAAKREKYDKTGLDSDKEEELQINSVIANITIAFLANIDNVKTKSLTEFIKTVMENKAKACRASIRSLEMEQEKATEIKSRISKTSGDNIILSVIEDKMAENSAEIARLNLDIYISDQVMKEMSGYEYRTEKASSERIHPLGWGRTGVIYG